MWHDCECHYKLFFKKYSIRDKSFYYNKTTINFGETECQRNKVLNLETLLRRKVIGIGCGMYIIYNCAQTVTVY